MNEIATIISSLGFPIVACGALARYINRLTQAHREEVKALADCIDRNTRAIDKLTREVHKNE